MQKYFTLNRRDNGETFYTLNDDAPEWLLDAIREAHDGMLPDDYIYEWVYDAAGAYDDYDGNLESALSNLEPQPYYNQLNAWFSSHLDRVSLVDDILQECGVMPIYNAIELAQIREKEHVYTVIFQTIKES